LALDPAYYPALTLRARLYRIEKNYRQALADSHSALVLSPYDAYEYFARGWTHEKLGQKDKAIHDYLVAKALDPNIVGLRRALYSLVGKSKTKLDQSRTAKYEPPRKGLKLVYLQTISNRGPAKSEVEDAIGDLKNWFRKKPEPAPQRAQWFLREVIDHDNYGQPTVRLRPHGRRSRVRYKVTELNYHRSIWPAQLPFPGGNLDIKVDSEFLGALFPLKVGNKAQCEAPLEFVAPAKLRPQDKFLGAKKPGDKLPFGNVKWKAHVVGWEQLTVGAGTFDTVVVKCEEQMTLELLGRAKANKSVVTWWYAPSIGWWVKRTRSLEGKLITDEAMTVE